MNTHSLLRYYQVAEHFFCLSLFSGCLPESALEAYISFQVEQPDSPLLFTLTVTEDNARFPSPTGIISYIEKGHGSITMFHTADGGIRIHLSLLNNPDCCQFYSNIQNRQVLVHLSGTPEEKMYGLDNSLMLAYTFTSSSLETLLVNASVIEDHSHVYLFPGRNGMNKLMREYCTTWLKYREGAILLNDEVSVIRVMHGRTWVYSTPWNEISAECCNRRLPLETIIQLMQAPGNRMTTLSRPAAYAALLSACWSMKWSDSMIGSIHSVIETLVYHLDSFRLECIPGEEAVKLCARVLKESAENKNKSIHIKL